MAVENSADSSSKMRDRPDKVGEIMLKTLSIFMQSEKSIQERDMEFQKKIKGAHERKKTRERNIQETAFKNMNSRLEKQKINELKAHIDHNQEAENAKLQLRDSEEENLRKFQKEMQQRAQRERDIAARKCFMELKHEEVSTRRQAQEDKFVEDVLARRQRQETNAVNRIKQRQDEVMEKRERTRQIEARNEELRLTINKLKAQQTRHIQQQRRLMEEKAAQNYEKAIESRKSQMKQLVDRTDMTRQKYQTMLEERWHSSQQMLRVLEDKIERKRLKLEEHKRELQQAIHEKNEEKQRKLENLVERVEAQQEKRLASMMMKQDRSAEIRSQIEAQKAHTREMARKNQQLREAIAEAKYKMMVHNKYDLDSTVLQNSQIQSLISPRSIPTISGAGTNRTIEKTPRAEPKMPKKTRPCGLCDRRFEVDNLPGLVSRQAVITMREKLNFIISDPDAPAQAGNLLEPVQRRYDEVDFRRHSCLPKCYTQTGSFRLEYALSAISSSRLHNLTDQLKMTLDFAYLYIEISGGRLEDRK